MNQATNSNGDTIKIGDFVGFKCDIEQSGKVIKIKKDHYRTSLVLENKNGFSGEYIGGQTKTIEDINDVWID